MATQKEPLQVNFTSLAIRDEAFGKIFERSGGVIDFYDPEMMQQITKSTLKVHFDLRIELPNDRLCPPVPVRFEYIRWIQAIVDSTSDEYSDEYDDDRDVVGIDIGIGASCIYPLLGCSTRPKWRFGGTDIDSANLSSATRNVRLNNLQSRVRLHESSPNGPVIPLDDLGIEHADFVMCNPPFYSSLADMVESASNKGLPPSAVCTGAEVEMITPGGDLGFAIRVFEESLVLRDRVQWYSLMLGKLSSAQSLVKKLKEGGVSNWAITCLAVGNVTRRWAVAWSFGNMRPSNDAARGTANKDDMLPFPTDLSIKELGQDDGNVMKALRVILTPLDMDLSARPADCSVICLSQGDVWSRAARRAKARKPRISSEENQETADGIAKDSHDDNEETTPTFGARITKIKGKGDVIVRWLLGNDPVVFEKFCGMVKRELTARCPA